MLIEDLKLQYKSKCCWITHIFLNYDNLNKINIETNVMYAHWKKYLQNSLILAEIAAHAMMINSGRSNRWSKKPTPPSNVE